MSVGFNAISTVLNHPTRRAHPIDPTSSRYPALAFSALPPQDVLLPHDTPPVDAERYVRTIKPSWGKLRRPIARQSSVDADTAAGPEDTEAVAPLDSVPSVFFDPDFSLSNPGYFERVFEVSASAPELADSGATSAAIAQDAVGSIPALLGEKLSFYSDVIEQHLVSALSERSGAILDAASSLQTLTQAGRECAAKTDTLQSSVRSLDEDVAHTGTALILRQHRRRRLQTLLSTLERIQSVVSRTEAAEQLAQQRRWLDALQAAEQVRQSLQEPVVLSPGVEAGTSKHLKLSDIASLGALSARLDGSTAQTSEALSGELQVALRDWITSSTTDLLQLEAGEHAVPSKLERLDANRLRALRARRNRSMHSSLALAAEQLAAATADAMPLPGTESSPVATASPIQGNDLLPSEEAPTQQDEEEEDQIKLRDKGLVEAISPLLAALSQAGALDSVPRALEQSTLQAIERIAEPAWAAAQVPSNTIASLVSLVNPTEGQGKPPEAAIAYLRTLSAGDFLERIHVYLDTLLDVLHASDKAATLLSQSLEDVQSFDKSMSQARTNTRSAAQAAAARIFSARGLALGSPLPAPSLADLEDPATVWADPELAAFLPPFQLGWGFMLRSRLPTEAPGSNKGSSGASDVLRSTLLRLSREFVAAVHGRRLAAAAVAVETERWNAKPVPAPVQDLVEVILLGATEDPEQLMISTEGREAATPSPQDTSSTSRDLKTLEIEGHRYFVVGATLLMLPQLGRYCRLVVNLPLICVEVLARLVEFLKQFNSRVCQLVLGAGALRSAGLTNINARHLALAEQSLSAVIGLLPYVRELVRRHLPKRMKLMLTEFDRLRQDYTDHRMEIQTKLVSILQERIAVHSRSLRTLNWEQAAEAEHQFRLQLKEKDANKPKDEEGATSHEAEAKEKEQEGDPGQEVPPQLAPLAGLLKDSSTLSTILSRYLPNGTLESIMRRAGASIDLHLAEAVRAIDWDALENPGASRSNGIGSVRSSMSLSRTSRDFVRPEIPPRDAMRADLARFIAHLHQLKGMGSWDPSSLLRMRDTVLAPRPPPSTPRASMQASRASLTMARDSPTPNDKLPPAGNRASPATAQAVRPESANPSAREIMKDAEPKRLGSPAPMIPSAANYAPPQPAPSPGPTIKYQPRQRPPRRPSTASPAPSPPPTGVMSPSIATNFQRHESISAGTLGEPGHSPTGFRPPASPVPAGGREYTLTTSYVPRRSSSALAGQHTHLRAPSEPVRSCHLPLGSTGRAPSPEASPPRPTQPPSPREGPLVTRPEPRRATTVPVMDDEDESCPILLAQSGPLVHVTAPSTTAGIASDDSDDDVPLAQRAAMLAKTKSVSPVPKQAPTPMMGTSISASPTTARVDLPVVPSVAHAEGAPDSGATPAASSAAEDTSTSVGADPVPQVPVSMPVPAPVSVTEVPPESKPPAAPVTTAPEAAPSNALPTTAPLAESTLSSAAVPAPTPAPAPAAAPTQPEKRNKRLSQKERLAEATRKRASLGKSAHSPAPSLTMSVKSPAPNAPTSVPSPSPAEPLTSSSAPAPVRHAAADAPPQAQPSSSATALAHSAEGSEDKCGAAADATSASATAEGESRSTQGKAASAEAAAETAEPRPNPGNVPVEDAPEGHAPAHEAPAPTPAADEAHTDLVPTSSAAAAEQHGALTREEQASRDAEQHATPSKEEQASAVAEQHATLSQGEQASPPEALPVTTTEAATSEAKESSVELRAEQSEVAAPEPATGSEPEAIEPEPKAEAGGHDEPVSGGKEAAEGTTVSEKHGELEAPESQAEDKSEETEPPQPTASEALASPRGEMGDEDLSSRQEKDISKTDMVSTDLAPSAVPTPEPETHSEAAQEEPESDSGKPALSKEDKEREKRRRKKKAQRQRKKK